MAEVSSGRAYTQFDLSNGDKLRVFVEGVEDTQLVWHRDKEDRRIYVQKGSRWKFQLDNELPVELKVGDIIEVPKMTYHRLIKGKGSLIVRIKEI